MLLWAVVIDTGCSMKLFYGQSLWKGERGGSVVECRTPEREVRGSKPTTAVLCPWARHFTPRKYWLLTQEAMAPSRYDWKIVDWDVKPQHNQPKLYERYSTVHRLELTAPGLKKSSSWSSVNVSKTILFHQWDDVSLFHVPFVWIIPKVVPLDHFDEVSSLVFLIFFFFGCIKKL